MSDFLSQFEKNNYNNSNKETKKEDIKETYSDKDTDKKEKEYQNSGIKSTEHDTEIDMKYHKRKIIRYVVIAITVVLLALIVFLSIYFLNRVTVKDFIGLDVSEAKTWGIKNNVEIDIELIFSVEQNNNIVVSQDKEANSKIQKGSILYVKVSKGADPEEKLELPDFSQMMQTQIREWVDSNKAYNINIIQEFSDTIEKNKFTKMEFKDSEIGVSNYKRKDALIIYISKGSEKDEKNITVPDFVGKLKTDVETWSKTNLVEVQYKESGSEVIEAEKVMGQDIAANTKIARTEILTVTISNGKGVVVPNFSDMSKEEASAVTDLIVTVKSIYNEGVPYGRLISQSVKSGTKLYGDKKRVDVVYSEGRPYIDNLVGKMERDLAPYFYDYSLKGANITYTIEHVDSHLEKGSVVWTSRVSEYIEMSTNIHIYISRGNLTPPQDGNGNTNTNTNSNSNANTNTNTNNSI